MLVSWGLKALFVGVSVATRAFASLHNSARSVRSQSAAVKLDIYNPAALDAFVEKFKTEHNRPPRTPAKAVQIDPSWTARETVETENKRPSRSLQTRDASCSPSAPVVCAGADGNGPVCSGCSTCCPDGAGGFQCCGRGSTCCISSNGAGSCCPDNGGTCGRNGCSMLPIVAQGVSTVFVTTTVMHTSTAAGGEGTTAVVTTVSETLTFVNPTQRTQTETLTVTSFVGRARRHVTATTLNIPPSAPARAASSRPTVTLYTISAHGALETQPFQMGVEVVRRRDTTVSSTTTSTVTIDVTTTITNGVLFTTTITNTIFVTTTVAPNAITTIFSTTTILTTPIPGQPTTSRGPTVTPTTGTISPTTLQPTSTPITPSPSPTPSSSSSSNMENSTNSSPVPTTSTTLTPPTSTANTETMTPATMMTSTELPLSTPTPSGPPPAFAGSPLSSDQIAGIALGTIFFIFFLIIAAFLIRRCVQRRRSQLAEERQALTPPSGGPVSSIPIGYARQGITPSPATGNGPGEVRIVIQPAPKRKGKKNWPMPPGHMGPTYSMFLDGETTGETTPQDPGRWSVTSEFGGSISPEPSGPGTRRASGVPSSGVFGTEGVEGVEVAHFGSGGGDVQSTEGRSTEARSMEGRPSGSSSGVRTRLQPPPPAHGTGRGWYRFGSPGVGRAL